MSPRANNQVSTSGRLRVWMLLFGALAYVALTFHASIALASMTLTAPSVANGTWGGVAATLHSQGSGPFSPCCGEQQCATLVAVGPLVPTAHEPITKFRYKVQAVIPQLRAPISAPVTGMLEAARNRRLFQQAPVFLSTSRLRL